MPMRITTGTTAKPAVASYLPTSDDKKMEAKAKAKTIAIKILAAVIAAFLILPFLISAAFAAEIDGTGELVTEENTEYSTQYDVQDIVAVVEGETDTTADLAPIPPGTGTVIDFDTDPEGRRFYTIMTAEEYIFHLVIDTNNSMDNVYLLRSVTIADLAALAEMPLSQGVGQSGMGASTGLNTPAIGNGNSTDPQADPTTTPDPEQDETQNGGNVGTIVFIIIIAVLGGGAGWYFKIYRPKQQSLADGGEYDPSLDNEELETDYTEGWDDEQGDNDDAPPWDVDENYDEDESRGDE